MRTTGISIALLCIAALCPGTQPGPLFHEDFRGPLRHWVQELEKPGSISARQGILDIDVPAGCTLWFVPELSGEVEIQYDALMVAEGGANDRVSDLKAFWMATDARSPANLFEVHRSGAFADYDRLRAYYVGLGGNSNTTTRFRRYIGKPGDRPLLPEHDLRSPDVLLKPNTWQTIRLIAAGRRIHYYRDSARIFDITDPQPYTHGNFGFRTTASHVRLRNFRVFRLR